MKYSYKVYKPVEFPVPILQENETGLYVFLNPSRKIRGVHCMDIPNKFENSHRRKALIRFKKWLLLHPEWEL